MRYKWGNLHRETLHRLYGCDELIDALAAPSVQRGNSRTSEEQPG